MADNVAYTPGSGAKVATRDVNYSGEAANAQAVGLVTFAGPDDGKIATDVTLENPLPAVAPRTDELLSTLTRLVKVCETLQVVDSAQRQRVTLDALAAGLTLGTVTTVTGVTTVATVTTVGSVTNVASIAGMDREQYINIARTAYNTGIRTQLQFT
jgi:hypothetical protein